MAPLAPWSQQLQSGSHVCRVADGQADPWAAPSPRPPGSAWLLVPVSSSLSPPAPARPCWGSPPRLASSATDGAQHGPRAGRGRQWPGGCCALAWRGRRLHVGRASQRAPGAVPLQDPWPPAPRRPSEAGRALQRPAASGPLHSRPRSQCPRQVSPRPLQRAFSRAPSPHPTSCASTPTLGSRGLLLARSPPNTIPITAEPSRRFPVSSVRRPGRADRGLLDLRPGARGAPWGFNSPENKRIWKFARKPGPGKARL